MTSTAPVTSTEADATRVIVAGGTGYIGRHLTAALLADGHRVTVLTRRRQAATDQGVDLVRWDPATPDPSLTDALDGADAVINLAGENIGRGRWTRRRRERLRASRVQATSALVAAMRTLPTERRPRALVNASGIDYYGDRGDDEIDESSTVGSSFLAALCAEWEAEALRAEDLGVRTVVMRTGVVLSGNAVTLRLMAFPFRLWVGGPLGKGHQWMAWIHLDDVVALYRRAVQDETLRGPVNAVAPGAVRQRDVASTLGRVLHRPAAFRVPSVVLRAVLGHQADLLLHGRRAHPVVATESGFTYTYPDIESALREALHRSQPAAPPS